MRVLMLGWEFPPYISGGLGTACYGLTKGMSQVGAEVVFVLPRPIGQQQDSHVKIVSPGNLRNIPGTEFSTPGSRELANVTIKTVDAVLQPYGGQAQHIERLTELQVAGEKQQVLPAWKTASQQDTSQDSSSQQQALEPQPYRVSAGLDVFASPGQYQGNLIDEVNRYAALVSLVARSESFDVIHAHDWMTYPAGIALAKATGKPLITHIHSTEFDRSGEHVNQQVYDIERQGMAAAARVIAVSYLTKRICAGRYDISPDKIDVVYNAIVNGDHQMDENQATIRKGEKIVLFLGRITMQKGPEYFLAAAKKVLSVMDNVKFIMAGSGDMTRRTIELAAELGIGHKVLFPGFLRGGDVEKVYRMADLYVMPSVSEPFGIAPLEAMSNNVPVIISRQSGVSEVLTHVLAVDFWDISEMANKIVAVLRHPPLQATLRQHGNFEVRKLSWVDSAQQCIKVYQAALAS